MNTRTITEHELDAHEREQDALRTRPEQQDPVLTIKDAVERLGIDRTAVTRKINKAIREKRIQNIREPGPKGRHYIRLSDLRKLWPDDRRFAQGRKRLTPAETIELVQETLTPGVPFVPTSDPDAMAKTKARNIRNARKTS